MSKTVKNPTVNRELSWLSFNHRVLQEAMDPAVPLVERLRFLGIYSNNMDEFFRVRVASMKRLEALQTGAKTLLGGKTAAQVLLDIQSEINRQKQVFADTYQDILAELEKHNIYMVNEKQLDPAHYEFVRDYYNEAVAPLLVPIMLKSAPEFPYLRDKSIYLAVKLSSRIKGVKKQYALIEIPSERTPRHVVLPELNGKKYIMFLDDVIRFNLDRIFRIMKYSKIEAYMIKITRDAELDLDEDVSKGFYEKLKKSLKQRKRGQPVRFLYDKEMSQDLLKYFMEKLHIDQDDNIISGGRYHNSKDFMSFPNVGTPDLENQKFPPLTAPAFETGRSMLHAVDQRDILLQYPYQKFSYFVHFLREAAIDPDVKEIKISLYRVARQSRVINALINAAKNGKHVTAIVELRARFDEEANLDWSKKLQENGVKILFGIPQMKVHAKLVVVSKLVNGDLKHYTVISTGNFNEVTARVYSDIALFTADKAISQDALKVFSLLEATYKNYRFKTLLVAPIAMRNRLNQLINNEIANAKKGRPAGLFLKMNSLVDESLIRRLYAASRCGIKIRLLVRGTCSLVPGIPGVSENIEVRSIIDKYLEHSRILVFTNGGEELVYLSSADWMTRSMDKRVEVACPIFDSQVKAELKSFMELQWQDNTKSRLIDAEKSNRYYKGKPGDPPCRSQVDMYYQLQEYLGRYKPQNPVEFIL